MKRVRVAPGKFVAISDELAEKAAQIFPTGLTRDKVHNFKTIEPRHSTGLVIGSSKPLALARPTFGVTTHAGKASHEGALKQAWQLVALDALI